MVMLENIPLAQKQAVVGVAGVEVVPVADRQ